MQQIWIWYPVLGMALLTFYIGMRVAMLRVKAVREDGLRPAYFLLNRGGKPPEYLIKMTHQYENLFELPILFYLGVGIVFMLNRVDYGYLLLAWSYFVLRIVHAYIHTTYNRLRHRRSVFLFSALILMIFWVRLAIELILS